MWLGSILAGFLGSLVVTGGSLFLEIGGTALEGELKVLRLGEAGSER